MASSSSTTRYGPENNPTTTTEQDVTLEKQQRRQGFRALWSSPRQRPQQSSFVVDGPHEPSWAPHSPLKKVETQRRRTRASGMLRSDKRSRDEFLNLHCPDDDHWSEARSVENEIPNAVQSPKGPLSPPSDTDLDYPGWDRNDHNRRPFKKSRLKVLLPKDEHQPEISGLLQHHLRERSTASPSPPHSPLALNRLKDKDTTFLKLPPLRNFGMTDSREDDCGSHFRLSNGRRSPQLFTRNVPAGLISFARTQPRDEEEDMGVGATQYLISDQQRATMHRALEGPSAPVAYAAGTQCDATQYPGSNHQQATMNMSSAGPSIYSPQPQRLANESRILNNGLDTARNIEVSASTWLAQPPTGKRNRRSKRLQGPSRGDAGAGPSDRGV